MIPNKNTIKKYFYFHVPFVADEELSNFIQEHLPVKDRVKYAAFHDIGESLANKLISGSARILEQHIPLMIELVQKAYVEYERREAKRSTFFNLIKKPA